MCNSSPVENRGCVCCSGEVLELVSLGSRPWDVIRNAKGLGGIKQKERRQNGAGIAFRCITDWLARSVPGHRRAPDQNLLVSVIISLVERALVSTLPRSITGQSNPEKHIAVPTTWLSHFSEHSKKGMPLVWCEGDSWRPPGSGIPRRWAASPFLEDRLKSASLRLPQEDFSK